MTYVFYYKERSGVAHISCTFYNDDNGEEGYEKIGNVNKLIEFIKRNCPPYSEVYFDGFDSSTILYILNQISDRIEINYPPIGTEGPYLFLERQIKKRGK